MKTTAEKLSHKQQLRLEEAERGIEHCQKLIQALKAPTGDASNSADLSVHLKAKMEEYQEIMRLIVRPGGTA